MSVAYGPVGKCVRKRKPEWSYCFTKSLKPPAPCQSRSLPVTRCCSLPATHTLTTCRYTTGTAGAEHGRSAFPDSASRIGDAHRPRGACGVQVQGGPRALSSRGLDTSLADRRVTRPRSLLRRLDHGSGPGGPGRGRGYRALLCLSLRRVVRPWLSASESPFIQTCQSPFIQTCQCLDRRGQASSRCCGSRG